jgi:hypothetical protein
MSVTIKSRIVSDLVILDVAGKFDIGGFAATFGEDLSGRRPTTLFVKSRRCSIPRHLGDHPNHLGVDGDSQRTWHHGIGCAGKGSSGRTPIYKARYGVCDL